VKVRCCTHTRGRQVSSSRSVQDDVLILSRLADSGVDKVPLGVGTGIAGFAVALLTSHRMGLAFVKILLDLDLRAICFVATGKIHHVLGIRVADDAVEVGANEVGHVGGLGLVVRWDCLVKWADEETWENERDRPGLYRGSPGAHDHTCHENRLRCVLTRSGPGAGS
jgi:hypothetical protein